jgi:hypothetical protein
MAGLRFVGGTPLLVTLAVLMGVWQMCHYARMVVQILFATRTLGLSEHAVGLCYMGMGVGTISGSVLGPAHQPPHRPRALPGGGLRHHRPGLAAAGRGAGQWLGRGRLCG